MINNLCILFSLVMVVYVAVRSSMLDSRRPWFEIVPTAPPPDAAPLDRRRDTTRR